MKELHNKEERLAPFVLVVDEEFEPLESFDRLWNILIKAFHDIRPSTSVGRCHVVDYTIECIVLRISAVDEKDCCHLPVAFVQCILETGERGKVNAKVQYVVGSLLPVSQVLVSTIVVRICHKAGQF